MKPHKVGIVIVSWNASLAVRITLASLRRAKCEVPYEVILVDNASSPCELGAIRSAFERHINEANLPWRYFQSKKNLGFAGANNIGIRMFLEDAGISHICLLNSDVIVTDYWLDRLLEKGCDIISPVTNRADSIQCVPVDYQLELRDCLDSTVEILNPSAFDKVNDFAQRRFTAWYGNVVPVEVTTFCCVLLSRDLVQRVGLLDSNFFPGGYEDDDYCMRARSSGFEVYLARDVFIHHWGSASFGRLQQAYFNACSLRNRKYLERKHKITWKARTQAPILSFMQDVVYALSGQGDHHLQQYFCELHARNLTGLLLHSQKEFFELRHLVLSRGHSVSQCLSRENVQASHVVQKWHDLTTEVRQAINQVPRESSEIDNVRKKTP